MANEKIDEWSREVASVVAKHLPVAPERVRLKRVSHKPDIEDASTAYLVFGEERKAIAAVLQGATNGDLATRGAMRACAAKDALGGANAREVLVPLEVGCIRERSFALYPYCDPLPRPYGVHLVSDWIIAASVSRWLLDAARRTQYIPSDREIETLVAGPIASLAQESTNEHVRRAAVETKAALAERKWSPRLVLMHGDLWLGNVLIAPRSSDARRSRFWWNRFVICDWAGAVMRGFPIYDLIRLAISARLPKRTLSKQISKHCEALDCDRSHARHHVLAALAHIHSNLERFPRVRFFRMADRCLETVELATSEQ